MILVHLLILLVVVLLTLLIAPELLIDSVLVERVDVADLFVRWRFVLVVLVVVVRLGVGTVCGHVLEVTTKVLAHLDGSTILLLLVLVLGLRLLALKTLDLALVLDLLTDVALSRASTHTRAVRRLALVTLATFLVSCLLRRAESLARKTEREVAEDVSQLEDGSAPGCERKEVVLDQQGVLGDERCYPLEGSLSDVVGCVRVDELVEMRHNRRQTEDFGSAEEVGRLLRWDLDVGWWSSSDGVVHGLGDVEERPDESFRRGGRRRLGPDGVVGTDDQRGAGRQ